MSLSPVTLNALYHLVEQDDILRTRLQGAMSVSEAAGTLAQAAAEKGIDVSRDALVPHLEEAARQASSGELSADELEAVSGGNTYTIQLINTAPPSPDVAIFQKMPPSFADSILPHLHRWMSSYPLK